MKILFIHSRPVNQLQEGYKQRSQEHGCELKDAPQAAGQLAGATRGKLAMDDLVPANIDEAACAADLISMA